MSLKIGVMLESFRLPLEQGIKKAAEVGADGLQISTVSGEMLPQNLSAPRRREILSRVKDSGLAISALCGDFGGHGFQVAADNPKRIEDSKRVMDLALEWEVPVVTTHIGVVSPERGNDRRLIMADACRKLGEYGAKAGATFAIETGPETAAVLKDFLEHDVGSKGVGVNFDPANLWMVLGDDPVAGVRTLGGHIVHTHAKDGIMRIKSDPERLYGFFAEGGIEDLRLSDYFLEVPLGEGGVDFPGWISALKSVGYDYFLTIEREVGANPQADIRRAVQFLKTLI